MQALFNHLPPRVKNLLHLIEHIEKSSKLKFWIFAIAVFVTSNKCCPERLSFDLLKLVLVSFLILPKFFFTSPLSTKEENSKPPSNPSCIINSRGQKTRRATNHWEGSQSWFGFSRSGARFPRSAGSRSLAMRRDPNYRWSVLLFSPLAVEARQILRDILNGSNHGRPVGRDPVKDRLAELGP